MMRRTGRGLVVVVAAALLFGVLQSPANAVGHTDDDGFGWTAHKDEGFYRQPPGDPGPNPDPKGPRKPPPFPWFMTEVDNPFECNDRPGCPSPGYTHTCLGDGANGRPWFVHAQFRKAGEDAPWTYQNSECVEVSDENWVPVEEFTATLREDLFKKIDRPAISFKPAPKSLVNIPVILSTQDPGPQSLEISVPLPGRIEARPHYTWKFEGGGTASGPGKAYDGTDPQQVPGYYPVTHQYESTGEKRVSLHVEWTGTVTVGDNPPMELEPLEYDVSETIQVEEADSVLTDR